MRVIRGVTTVLLMSWLTIASGQTLMVHGSAGEAGELLAVAPLRGRVALRF